MAVAYLSLGSNIDPERNLRAAVAALRLGFGSVVLSPIYRTQAVGFAGEPFLNAAARIESDLDPRTLDVWLHSLEDAHGRRRDVPRFSSRTLDVDLLLYDDLIFRGDGNLQVPRPELVEQEFVLRPMVDLAPEFVHPVMQQTLSQIWRESGSAKAGTLVVIAGL